MNHRVRYGGGDQTVYHVPRDRYGRVRIPASATYSIVRLWEHEDSAERVVVASTAATIDSASTTLTAAAGPAQANPRMLAVTSSASFVAGHRYLLRDGELFELVEVEATDTAQVLLKHELRHDYTTSGTLLGIELPGTFPSAAAADESDLEAGGGPYGVIWAYTLSSVPTYTLEEAWVVRYTTQPLITTADLLRRWPRVSEMCKGRWNPEDLIAAATEDFLADVEEAGRDPHYIRHSTVTTVCVADRALEKLLRLTDTESNVAHAEVLRQDYERRVRNLLTGAAPKRTAEVSQSTGTATQGGTLVHGMPLIRRS